MYGACERVSSLARLFVHSFVLFVHSFVRLLVRSLARIDMRGDMWTKYINTWRKRMKSGRRRHILHTHTANLYSFLCRGAKRRRVRARKRESKRHRVGSNGIARAQPSGAIKFTCTHIFGGSDSSRSSSDMCVYMVHVLCVRPHSDLSLSCYHTKQWGTGSTQYVLRAILYAYAHTCCMYNVQHAEKYNTVQHRNSTLQTVETEEKTILGVRAR